MTWNIASEFLLSNRVIVSPSHLNRQKLQTQAKAIDEVMKELGVKIEATKKENEQLIDENLKLKVDLASKAEEMLRDEKRLKTN